MRIAAIVPAYNESHAITGVVSELLAAGKAAGLQLEVIVVNDCSTDSTGSIIDQLPCVALHLPVNLGIGGFDFAVQVDGDGQHPAAAIPKMVEAAQANGWDVTIGSRFLSREGFQSTTMRRAGINYFRRLNRWLTGITISDTTSGFRLLNRNALAVVNDYYPDEYPEPEAIVLFAGKKLSVGEIPVRMRERQGGVSSINSLGAAYYMGKVTLACLFTRIRKA
jgi:glycosyltransferase involved in cell wall biosynthesis